MAVPTESVLLIATETLGGDGFNSKESPIAPVTTKGYGEQALTYQQLNYMFNNQANWLKYINEEQVPAEATTRSDDDITLQDNIDAEATTRSDDDITLQDALTALTNQVNQMQLPVGSVFEITGDNTNPATLLGYGVWSSFGEGVSLVGAGSHTDDRGESKTWADADTEGEYKHVQTLSELAAHEHVNEIPSDGSPDGNTDISSTSSSGSFKPEDSTSVGSSTAMNNTQPSLAVYRWKRDS